MKKIILITFTIILISSNTFSEEISDCTQFKKFSGEYIKCKATNTKNKISQSKLGKGMIKLKNSKTGADFIKN